MEGEDSMKGWPFYIHFTYSIFLLFTGVPGNLAVIYFFQFKQQHHRRSSYNIYVSYIAFVDLIVCLFRVIPYSLYLSGVFTENRELFYILYIIPFVGSDVSLWGLWGLSSNRYWKFTKPMREQLNKAYVTVIPLSFSFLIRFPYDIFIQLSQQDLFVVNIIQFVTQVIFLSLIPITSIVILYRETAAFLLKQSEFSRKSTRQKDKDNQNITALESMKALTISMFIAIAIPRMLLVIESGISTFGKMEIGKEVYDAIECVVYNVIFTNNAINVFIYYKFIRSFRRFIVPKWLRHRNHVGDSSASQDIQMVSTLKKSVGNSNSM